MTAIALGPKILSRTHTQDITKNHKHSCCVDRQQVRSIDQTYFSSNYLSYSFLDDDDNCE